MDVTLIPVSLSYNSCGKLRHLIDEQVKTSHVFCAKEIYKTQNVTDSTFKMVMYTCLRDAKPPEGEPDRGTCLRGAKPPEGEPDRGVRSPEQCDVKTV